MRPLAAVSLALLVMLLWPAGAVAGGPPPETAQQQPAVDRWHRLREYYSMDPKVEEGRRLLFGICPGAGVRAGAPGTLFGVADLYLSVARRHSFSLFAGAGIEARSRIRAAVLTLGWGGVRRIHVARRQTGFFGAFLRYRDYVGEAGASRDDAFSAGTEMGAGHLCFTFELGASRRIDGEWKFLAYAGFKLIWALPLGW